MDDLDTANQPNGASNSAKTLEKDPVCGMDVNPATARHKTLHRGTLHEEKAYFFCSSGCLTKFEANPEKILSSPPRPMTQTSGLVFPGGPALVTPTLGKVQNVEWHSILNHQQSLRVRRNTHVPCILKLFVPHPGVVRSAAWRSNHVH